MTIISITFDSLGYFEELRNAGVPEAQARAQADALRRQVDAQEERLRQQAEEQRAALQRELQRELERYDEASRRELATKGDVQDVRLEIEKVRAEVEKVRAELKIDIEKVRADVEKVRYDLLKWMIGIGAALASFMLAGFGGLAAIMARGFHWMGF